MKNDLSPEYLKTCLIYDPESGGLEWRVRPEDHFSGGAKTPAHEAAIWNSKYAGKPAFANPSSDGYRRTSVSGRKLLAHRVAWALHFGAWPGGEIDHINGVRHDNRMANLRCVDRQENARNLSVTSGESRGVYWYAPTSRWVSKIYNAGKMLHLGYFKSRDDAVAARRAAERKYGFHENHGRAF